jgi:hypothetical protein
MSVANIVVLFALGCLGASSVIAKKKPEAKELLAKLAQFSGYIGVLAFCWGVWQLVLVILHLNWLFAAGILYFVTSLGVALVMIALGLIFGFGLLSTFVKNEEAIAKGEALRSKLVPYQLLLGYASLGLSVWLIVFTYVLH